MRTLLRIRSQYYYYAHKILQVYPAAGYAYKVAEHGGTVAVFNIQHSEGDEDAHFLFLGPCEKTLPFVLFGAETGTGP